MASVMHLLRHRVKLVEELLQVSAVDAQDVPVDVGGFLAMMVVGHVLSTDWSYMANGLLPDGDYCLHAVLTLSPAFRDREARSMNNRDKPTDDGLRQDRHSNRIEGGRDRGSYDGRGGRGGRAARGGRGNRDDRHTRGVPKCASPHPPYEICLY